MPLLVLRLGAIEKTLSFCVERDEELIVCGTNFYDTHSKRMLMQLLNINWSYKGRFDYSAEGIQSDEDVAKTTGRSFYRTIYIYTLKDL